MLYEIYKFYSIPTKSTIWLRKDSALFHTLLYSRLSSTRKFQGIKTCSSYESINYGILNFKLSVVKGHIKIKTEGLSLKSCGYIYLVEFKSFFLNIQKYNNVFLKIYTKIYILF